MELNFYSGLVCHYPSGPTLQRHAHDIITMSVLSVSGLKMSEATDLK